MANKKITVVGDGSEEPLSPEEEHRIEVKIDEMMDPTLPDAAPEAKIEPVSASEDSVVEPSAEPEPTPTEAPKVTKIVTKFADEPDDESDNKPADEVMPQEASVPPQPSAEPPPPIKKKIMVVHHDDIEDEAAAQPIKAAKPKPATKKTAKNKSATSEETAKDDLASKADAIAASALVAEEMMGTKQEVSAKEIDEQPEVQDTGAPDESEVEAVTDDLAETAVVQSVGAPPLLGKHGVAPINAPAASVDTTAETDESTQTTEITVDAPPEPAESVAVEVETPAEPIEEKTAPAPTDNKKYRPPEGPIQFKRAEVPIQPHKPGEPRAAEATPTEISEDAALAKAFETTKATRKGDVVRGLAGALLKLLKWVVILLIIGSVVAVGAVPSLRNKALNLVGLHNNKPSTSSAPATNVAETAPSKSVQRDIYLAKRSGTYNLYKITNAGPEQLVLAGTGKEDADLALAPNASSKIAALVSTRDGKQDSTGTVQQSIALVDVAAGTATSIDSADKVKLVDWFGDRIVYVLLNTTTSTSDANRYQLVSYDTDKKVRTVLDHTNYLNDVLAAKGSLYYATATSSASTGQVVKMQPDGSGKRVILTAEVADISRVSYGSAIFSSVNKWYSYELDALQATATNNVNQSIKRLYIDSPDAKQSAYISDAKGTAKLVVTDTKTGKETTLAVTDAAYPIYWLSNDTIAYRSGNSDYSIKLSGGQPTKLADVFDAAGISLWHEQ